MRDVELQPMIPGMQLICVALGFLVPCLLGFCVLRSPEDSTTRGEVEVR